jgi:hypothetical protein
MNTSSKILFVVAMVLFISVASGSVGAFGLPKIPGLGGSSTSSVDVGGLINQNEGIVKRYQSALVNLLKAQEVLADAIGIQIKSQKKDAAAETLGKGIADKEQLEKATATAAQNQEAINKKLAEGVTLDAASKMKFGQAIIPYAKGTLEGSLLTSDAVSYASNVTTAISQLSANPMDLMKLKNGAAAGLYVGMNLPGLIKEWFGSTQTMITFGQKNDIDTSGSAKILKEIPLS